MGWSSGNDIFDPVARDLILEVDSQCVPKHSAKIIIIQLIKQLQEHGWDTEGESLGEFRNHPWIVEAFEECGVTLDDEISD